MELTLEEWKREMARPGVRCILQVRHAERPKMDPKDPTFGDTLALTPEGCRTARELGRLLAEFRDDVTFVSSPLRRTRMTAELIAEGMGLGAVQIPAFGCLGNESFYYNDVAKVLEVFTPPENFFPACIGYYRTGRLSGFNELHEASDNLERWLVERHERKLLVATTHDCYIAAFLSARGAIAEFSRANWPRFLDAGAIFIYPDGARRYAMVRTGLSTGIVGVKPEQSKQGEKS